MCRSPMENAFPDNGPVVGISHVFTAVKGCREVQARYEISSSEYFTETNNNTIHSMPNCGWYIWRAVWFLGAYSPEAGRILREGEAYAQYLSSLLCVPARGLDKLSRKKNNSYRRLLTHEPHLDNRRACIGVKRYRTAELTFICIFPTFIFPRDPTSGKFQVT